MFGFFNKRRRWNGDIDTLLNNSYQIATRGNSLFPAPIKYLSILDNAWNANMNHHEGALYIATLYFCATVKRGHVVESGPLLGRINKIVGFNLQHGQVDIQLWHKCANLIDEVVEEIEGRS